ncbi:MAG: GntR family transcriptional regulator [Bifidobacteriaceae bacterium]|jgi:DNA-binding GntR family transcriptional regulator|nr:GntR family transcriptional regulator [Bifidobacteriaceae bacterium]
MPSEQTEPLAGAIPVVRRQVLGDGVFDAIRGLLLNGNLQAGDRISVDGLARQFGVSPTPVREALARIEASGLVVREPMRGYKVAPAMSRTDLEELMDARILIEPYNAEVACRLGPEGLVRDLEAVLGVMANAPLGPGFEQYRVFLESDQNFHKLIGRAAGNAYLARAVEGFGGHLRRFSLFGVNGVADALTALAEHRLILEAMKQRRPEEAASAMRDHLKGVRERALVEFDIQRRGR